MNVGLETSFAHRCRRVLLLAASHLNAYILVPYRLWRKYHPKNFRYLCVDALVLVLEDRLTWRRLVEAVAKRHFKEQVSEVEYVNVDSILMHQGQVLQRAGGPLTQETVFNIANLGHVIFGGFVPIHHDIGTREVVTCYPTLLQGQHSLEDLPTIVANLLRVKGHPFGLGRVLCNV